MSPFAEKVAFVTGATSGIGRATALAFARGGASVVVADVAADGARETSRLIEQAGGQALAGACDVTSREQIEGAAAAAGGGLRGPGNALQHTRGREAGQAAR